MENRIKLNYKFNIRSWIIKLKFNSYLKKLFINTGLIILIIFFLTGLYTDLNPKNIHVSGYTRRDGTRVESYNRRSPGMAIEDQDEELGINLLVIALVILVILELYWIYNLRTRNPFELLPTYLKKPALPKTEKPLYGNFIPKKGRKNWSCKSCKNEISSGEIYYLNIHNYNEYKYCSKCKDALILYKENYSNILEINQKKYNDQIDQWQNLLLKEYELTFKIKLNENDCRLIKSKILS